MPKFYTVILCEVEADTYEEAQKETEEFAEIAAMNYPKTDSPAVLFFDPEPDFSRDNLNQRVLYLHDEAFPIDR